LQKREAAQLPLDCSDLIAAISVQIKRLQWSGTEIRDRLQARYQKSNRAMLSETELRDWLIHLQSRD
jgi:hypothetical protein